MVCLNERAIDLYTHDENLSLKIFRVFENLNHETFRIDKTDSGEKEMYCFYNLSERKLAKYLKTLARKYEFELRESKTGEFLKLEDLID